MSQPAVLTPPEDADTTPTDTAPNSAAAPVIPDEPLDTDPELRLRVTHHAGEAVVVHARGSLDARTTPRLVSLLTPRLDCAASTLVLDLSGVEFVGTAAVGLLIHARLRTASRGLTFHVVDGPRCLNRALHAAQATGAEPFTTYPTVPTALTDQPGNEKETPR